MTTAAPGARRLRRSVVFISGRGGAGRSWHLHQVPAFRCRGLSHHHLQQPRHTADHRVSGRLHPPRHGGRHRGAHRATRRRSGPAGGVLHGCPHRAGTHAHPPRIGDRRGVHGHSRARDATRSFFRKAELELSASGVEVPAAYQAAMRLLLNFSPKTLNNDAAIKDWIDMFMLWPEPASGGIDHQRSAIPARTGPAPTRTSRFRRWSSGSPTT